MAGPGGFTTTGVLTDSLDEVISSARLQRDYLPVVARLVDTTRLEENIGINWTENLINRFTAGNIDELTDLEQTPQQVVDSGFSIRPVQMGISVIVTSRAKARISSKVVPLLGIGIEKAMMRKKDKDLIAIGQSASTDLGTAGSPMESGFVSAAVSRIAGNETEPWDGPTATVLHPFQKKDIQDEIVAGIGTYTVPVGLTESVYLNGWSGGSLYDSEMWADGNIPIDSNDDATGFTFGKGTGGAIVHVEGMEANYQTKMLDTIGHRGAELMWATDEYANGIRQQEWIYSYTTDATAPTN
jgi:hypothetical protein